jgi:hypothetical protein
LRKKRGKFSCIIDLQSQPLVLQQKKEEEEELVVHTNL